MYSLSYQDDTSLDILRILSTIFRDYYANVSSPLVQVNAIPLLTRLLSMTSSWPHLDAVIKNLMMILLHNVPPELFNDEGFWRLLLIESDVSGAAKACYDVLEPFVR